MSLDDWMILPGRMPTDAELFFGMVQQRVLLERPFGPSQGRAGQGS
jgi:hypothetical protein